MFMKKFGKNIDTVFIFFFGGIGERVLIFGLIRLFLYLFLLNLVGSINKRSAYGKPQKRSDHEKARADVPE